MALNRRGKKLSEGLERMADASGEAWGGLYLGIKRPPVGYVDAEPQAAVWPSWRPSTSYATRWRRRVKGWSGTRRT